jgi:two-component system nitrate/nitrite response regulator NarL
MDAVLLLLRSQLLRDAISVLLSDSGFSVSAEAADVDGALSGLPPAQWQAFEFIIVGADLCSQRANALGDLRAAAENARIVILADPSTIDHITNDDIAVAAGVLTYDITSEGMVQALRLMKLGERVVQRDLLHSLLHRGTATQINLAEGANGLRGRGDHAPSPREEEILKYLLQGYSNKMIARGLGITEATVKVHLKGLLRKIRAANRTQAAIWALNNGYSTAPPTPPGAGAP